MIKEGSKLNSIFKMKCPQCQKGDFFKGSFFKGVVHERCESCNLKFEMEPGFFQGSYYVVYALGVATFVTTWIIISLFFPDLSMDASLIVIVLSLLLTAPIMYPFSKIIWANFFIKYKKK